MDYGQINLDVGMRSFFKRAPWGDLLILLLFLAIFIYPLIVHDYSALAENDNALTLAWHQYAINSFSKGEFPYWDPYNYYNFFTTATWIFYPIHLFWYFTVSLFSLKQSIETIYFIFIIILLFHFYINSLAMYTFLRYLNIERVCALFGAAIYSYNLYSLTMGGLMVSYIRLSQYAAMPLFFLCVLKLLQSEKKKVEWALLSGFLLGATILCGQIQPLIYFIPIIFLFVIWYVRSFQGRKEWSESIKGIYYVSLTFIIAFGLTAVQAIPTIFHLSDTLRSRNTIENIMIPSMSPFYMMMANILPSFSSSPLIAKSLGGQGDLYHEALIFFGTSTMIFSFLGIFSKNRYLPVFIFLLIYSLILIMGANTIWGYIQFDLTRWLSRYPSRATIVVMFSLSYLAAAGLEYIGKTFNKLE